MSDDVENEPASSVAEGELVAIAQDGRVLLAGDAAEIDRFITDLRPERELDVSSRALLARDVHALATSFGSAAVTKRYIELGAQQWKALSSAGGPSRYTSEIRKITRDGATGRIVANQPYSPAKSVVATQPEVLIAMAAIQMALESLTEAVEEVAQDVEDLKRIAETAEIGNLVGLYRVLANARAQVDQTGTISRTTWESVATHEVTAQQAADRIRAYLRRVMEDLTVDGDTGERLKVAQRLLKEGTLRRSLRLLVLAEQCRLLWRSLKLDRVRVAESDGLEAEAEAATAMLAENAKADRELVEILRDGVAQLTRVTALDGVKLASRTKLPAAGVDLRAQVDEFAAARQQQFDSWAPGTAPGIRDAAREARLMAARAAVEGRRAVGGWIAGVGTRIQGSAEPVPREQRGVTTRGETQ